MNQRQIARKLGISRNTVKKYLDIPACPDRKAAPGKSLGDWCYIGSNSRFVPGSGVGYYTFVGMETVLTKSFTENCVLIAGNPSSIKKMLSQKEAYFDRKYLPHDHHLKSYKG